MAKLPTMKCPSHLCVDTVHLAPSVEWTVSFPGWCFLSVREGQGYWLRESGGHELNAADVVALSPLRDGFLRASQLGPVTLAYFRFAPEMLTGLLTPAERDSFERLSAHPRYSVRFLSPPHPGVELFAQISTSEAVSNAFRQRCETLRIVAAIFAEELTRPLPVEATFLSARQRLTLFMNQIPEMEFLKLSPSDVAARCSCSLTHFNRSFFKLFGMSFRRKVELIRLQKARQVLLESSCRIEKIASELGYASEEDFVAAFKKHFGLEPGEWRNPTAGLAGQMEETTEGGREASEAARLAAWAHANGN